MNVALPIVVLAEGGSDMLTPDGSLLFTILLFLALVPVLNRIVFRPIAHVLDQRDRLTAGSDTDTTALLGAIDQRAAEYEEGIRDARSESYRLVESRRAAAMAERQAKIAAVREEAAGKIAEARATIERESEEARQGLEADAGEIAAEISATLLGRAAGGRR